MRDRLIGIDAGGTFTKAVLFDAFGHEFACERRPNQTFSAAVGWMERDADGVWAAVAGAIRGLLENTGTSAADIAAISITGYGGGLYLVDDRINPIRAGIGSTDSRAAGTIANWRSLGKLASNEYRIQQRIWPGQTTALLGWFSEHQPDAITRTRHVLFCKDFLRTRLCGDISTDPTDAGIAGLIDVATQRYQAEMLGDLGLEAWLDKLPPIAEGTEIAGEVTASAAALTGLLAGTPVVRGLVDVTASALASGVVEPSQISVVAGTFSINSTLHDAPRLSTLPFLQTPYPIDGRFIATEGAATSAGNFEWFCRTLLSGEAARAAASGRSLYDLCNELVASALPRDSHIVFLPYLFGGESPPAALFGMRADDALGDVLKAIFEGIVFAHRIDIERLLSGPDAAHPVVVRLAGGASRSDVWGQMFADVIGLPIEIADGSELEARGVAICASAAIGLHPELSTAIKRMVRIGRRFEPSEKRDSYTNAFNRFQTASRLLHELRPHPL